METAAVVRSSEEHAEGFAAAEVDDGTGCRTACGTVGDGALCS